MDRSREERLGPRKFEPRRFGPRRFGPRRFGPRTFGTRHFGPRKLGARSLGRIVAAACASIPLLLAGCLLGPDYERPDVAVPESFREPTAVGTSIAELGWWELFEDEVLLGLIETSLRENPDIEIALARIAESRAVLGITRADQFPSFGYGAGATRTDLGDGLSISGFGGPRNLFDAGIDAFFEVDLWGRLRRSTEAARRELLATEAAYHTVVLSLVADVASTYFLLRDLDARSEIARRTLESRQRSTEIIRQRFDGGYVSMLDVHQAEIEEATAAANLASFERGIAQAEHALSVLLGRNPGAIPRNRGPVEDALPIGLEVPVGLPSEILERRPDLAAAESRLAAQTARIGVAEAQLLPSLTLTGAFGYRSRELEDVLSSGAETWSLAANLVGPIFEFGRNRRRIEAEEARTRAAVAEYERAVLVAFREVADALVAARTFGDEYEARVEQVEAAEGAARLSRALYDEDFTSYLEVLTAERSLFNAELAASIAKRERLVALVGLYKALGGGWSVPDDGGAADAEAGAPTEGGSADAPDSESDSE